MKHLRAFFNYGIKRGYLSENPVARLDLVESSPKEVEVVLPEGVERMLEIALEDDLALLSYLALGFFCGIQPKRRGRKLGSARSAEGGRVKLTFSLAPDVVRALETGVAPGERSMLVEQLLRAALKL
jgi:hypothetical protein